MLGKIQQIRKIQKTLKIKIVILLVFFSVLALGQNNNEKILLTSDGKYSKYYVVIDKNKGLVINLNNYYDKAGIYYVTRFIDTLAKSEDNNEILFTGSKSKIQLINKETNIIIENHQENIKSMKLDTVNETNSAYIDINNGIWWNVFLEMWDEINKSFPLNHYSFRNGFSYWELFSNKNENFQSFQDFVNNKANFIKDSLTSLNTPLVELTNELLLKIDTIKYEDLKIKLMKLPIDYKSNSWYFGTVLNALCNSRPEYFYKLVEEMPEKKEMLFRMADSDKNTRNKLKKAETESPMKREFIKYRRGETAFAVWGITFYTAGTIAFWGGIIYLIVK